MSHLLILCNMGKKVCLSGTIGVTCTITKSKLLEFLWLTDFEQWETNLIFWKSLPCNFVEYEPFFDFV